MIERPVDLCRTEVNAILARRQVQIRRLIDPQPSNDGSGGCLREADSWVWRSPKLDAGYCHTNRDAMQHLMLRHCPFGQDGDRLWVREALRQHGSFGFPLGPSAQCRTEDGVRIWSYAADDMPEVTGRIDAKRMPRWASRMTLEVASVRVQRLQEMRKADAIAEGIAEDQICGGELGVFIDQWDKRYARRAPWATNPWTWVVSFHLHEEPL